MGIERNVHVVNHPKDGEPALGLTQAIALTGMLHLLYGQAAGFQPRMEEIEIVGSADMDHGHGWHDKIYRDLVAK